MLPFVVFIVVFSYFIEADPDRVKFCINKTVDEVRNDFVRLSKTIADAKASKVCKNVGWRWKSVDKVKCDAEWYPNPIGSGWHPETAFKPIDYTTMKQKTVDAYSIGAGPYIEWYGNMYLDFYIYDTFFRKGDEVMFNGTYLETGGADGIIASNTLFYDRFLNWDGILIEPTVCADVQIPFNRPRAVAKRGGVCETESTLSVSNMKDFCPDDDGYTGWNDPVRCSPVKDFLQEAKPKVGRIVDFMSIDIESYYMNALRTIPFDESHIRVILIECTDGLHHCKEFLEKRGYLTMPVKSTVPNYDEDLLAWKNDCHVRTTVG